MARCRSCQQEIIWVRTASGKAMPVDAQPSPDGNVAVGPVRGLNGQAHRAGRVLRAGEEPAPGEARHRAHHWTCQFADRHRKPKAAAGPPAEDGPKQGRLF